MKEIITILAAIVLAMLPAFAQIYQSYSPEGREQLHNKIGVVSAKSGLILRAEPTTRSAVLGKIASGEMVSVFESSSFPSATFEGITAPWLKICHKGKCGYAFGGFISDIRTYEVIYPDMFIEGLDEEKQYVAVCHSNDYGYFTLLLEGSKVFENGMPNADKFSKVGALFVLDGLSSVGRIKNAWHGTRAVLPGEIVELAHTRFFAQGTTRIRHSEAVLDGYSLRSFEMDNSDMLLPQTILASLDDLGLSDSSIPRLKWVGDLDGDDQVDVVVEVLHGDTTSALLFLTELAENSNQHRCVAMTHSYFD